MVVFLLVIQAVRTDVPTVSWPAAALIDVALISAFGLVHSVMSRSAFKRLLTQVIPPAAERATFVLQSSVILALIFLNRQPIPAVIWQADGVVEGVILAVFCTGLGVITLATFLLGHSEFTGVRQAWDNLVQVKQLQPTFRTPLLYRLVRHPLQLGIVITMFAVPIMKVDGLIFAVAMLSYSIIGLKFEERALVQEFGATYQRYQESVPMLFPRLPLPSGCKASNTRTEE